jgi:hypothetical protein
VDERILVALQPDEGLEDHQIGGHVVRLVLDHRVEVHVAFGVVPLLEKLLAGPEAALHGFRDELLLQVQLGQRRQALRIVGLVFEHLLVVVNGLRRVLRAGDGRGAEQRLRRLARVAGLEVEVRQLRQDVQVLRVVLEILLVDRNGLLRLVALVVQGGDFAQQGQTRFPLLEPDLEFAGQEQDVRLLRLAGQDLVEHGHGLVELTLGDQLFTGSLQARLVVEQHAHLPRWWTGSST